MQAPKDPIPHVIIRTAESDHGLSLAMEVRHVQTLRTPRLGVSAG